MRLASMMVVLAIVLVLFMMVVRHMMGGGAKMREDGAPAPARPAAAFEAVERANAAADMQRERVDALNEALEAGR